MSLYFTQNMTELYKEANNARKKHLTSSLNKHTGKPIEITPLNLDEFRRRLLEDEDDEVDAKRTESKENIKPTSPVPSKEDSFDIDFSTLLETPAKVQPIKEKQLATSGIMRQQDPCFATPSLMKQRKIHHTPRLHTPGNPFINKPKPVHLQKHLPQLATFSEDTNQIDKLKRIVVNNKEYIVSNLLGKGGTSEVYQCLNPVTNTFVAIKAVLLNNSDNSQAGFREETAVLCKLQHCDRVIKLIDFENVEGEKHGYMVMEKGEKDLNTILKQLVAKRTPLPLYRIWFYWMEMLYAVKQIHENGVIHTDLKPANFIHVDGGLKLIDFGIATRLDLDSGMTSVLKPIQEGTFYYISPEALKNVSPNSPSQSNAKYKLNFKSDVWSLGCILYQLVYMQTPFQHFKKPWEVLSAIANPAYQVHYPQAPSSCNKIINTIRNCLKYNYKERPSVDDLIKDFQTFC